MGPPLQDPPPGDAATGMTEPHRKDSGAHCRWCGEPLPLLARLKGMRYCSEWHERQHRRQQAELFLDRVKKYRRVGGGSRLRSESTKIIIRPGRFRNGVTAPPPAGQGVTKSSLPENWAESPAPPLAFHTPGGWRTGSLPDRGTALKDVQIGMACISFALRIPEGSWSEQVQTAPVALPGVAGTAALQLLSPGRPGRGAWAHWNVRCLSMTLRASSALWYRALLWVPPRLPQPSFFPCATSAASVSWRAFPGQIPATTRAAQAVHFIPGSGKWQERIDPLAICWPAAPGKRWSGLPLQPLFTHIARPMPRPGGANPQRRNSGKPEWYQAVTGDPRRVENRVAGCIPPQPSRSLFVLARPTCRQTLWMEPARPKTGLAAGSALWTANPEASTPHAGSLAADSMSRAAEIRLGRQAGEARLLHHLLFLAAAPGKRSHMAESGAGPEVRHPGGKSALPGATGWMPMGSSFPERLSASADSVKAGYAMSWPNHVLIPCLLPRAAPSEGASTAVKPAAMETWFAPQSGHGLAAWTAEPQFASLARWRIASAGFDWFHPGRGGISVPAAPLRSVSAASEKERPQGFTSTVAAGLRLGHPPAGPEAGRMMPRALLAGLPGPLPEAAPESRIRPPRWDWDAPAIQTGPLPGVSVCWRAAWRAMPRILHSPDRFPNRPMAERFCRLRLPALYLRFPAPAAAGDGRSSSATDMSHFRMKEERLGN